MGVVASAGAGLNAIQRGATILQLRAPNLTAREVADYVIFGPVWPSPSHADQKSHGIGALADVARAVRIPVLAIGGVTSERADECAKAGAAGYAAITLFR